MTQVTYKPMLGEDIRESCRRACDIATKSGKSVAFRFNGIDVTVEPGEQSESAFGRWSAENERQAEAYRNSPEGNAAQVEREHKRRLSQNATDALMAILPTAVKSLDGLVCWCVAMSDAADYVGVTWDREAAIATIEAAGYVENAHVGAPPEVLDADRQMMGEYLVGQSLSFMRKGYAPHQIIQKFAKEGGFLV